MLQRAAPSTLATRTGAAVSTSSIRSRLKGSPPTGVAILMFETLAERSGDEPGTMYGLVAEEMLVPPDKSSITFRVHPKARFYNGDPVTAADVKHSYDMLVSKGAAPAVRAQFQGVKGAQVVDERTIRFDLSDRSDDTIFTLGTLPVFSRKWGQTADGKQKPLDEIVTDYPITSGAYTIASTDSGRGIEFVRNPDYWARDLGVRRGQLNFDRIIYRLFADRAVSMEAFKAGEFELIQEYVPQQWVRQHDGAKWRDGRISKKVFEYGMGKGLQAYLLNLRRPHVPGPPRARGARLQLRLRKDQSLQRAATLVQPVLQFRLCRSRLAGPGRAQAAGAISRQGARRGVRPALQAAAHGHGTQRAAREPEESARPARTGGMEGRRRRNIAQCEGRAVRIRVSGNPGRSAVPHGDVAAQPGETRYHA